MSRWRGRDVPKDGKLFVAANPWPLAAQAHREGLATDRFVESDLVPDGQVFVIDLDAVRATGPVQRVSKDV